MTDLEAYAPLSGTVAALGLDEEARFGPEVFPGALDELTSVGGLVLRGPGRRFVSNADTPNLPFEMVDIALAHDWFAERETYRRVGLWLLHLLFCGRSFAGLRLTHPESRLGTLWVHLEREDARRGGLLRAERRVDYLRYDHFRMPVVRHPFALPGERVADADRPMFRFGWSDAGARCAGDYGAADEMILSLTPDGLCAMASLLMDFAADDNAVDEMNLETPVLGFAATQPLSVEARFWLPGSFGFYAETLAQMDFTGMG
ncbi:hypothetical protein HKCCE4037_18510 [Rhodobacterales bacterium HKCCE4037]|nr:hypothetical protein [Rhodobacterales bacterium HKCCE4037]